MNEWRRSEDDSVTREIRIDTRERRAPRRSRMERNVAMRPTGRDPAD
jgi:hypothetical protein